RPDPHLDRGRGAGESDQPRPRGRHPRPRAAQGAAGLMAGLPGQAANGLAPWTQGQIDRRADRRGAGRPSVTAYADSGVIAKLYVLEPNSSAAAHLVSPFAPPLPLTHLQALEVRNALRLKAFRGEMTRTQLRRTLLRLTDDIPQGRGAVGKACSQYGVPQCRYSARRRS